MGPSSDREMRRLAREVADAVLPPPAQRQRIRESAGVARPEAARALGVDNNTLARWEAGGSAPQTREMCDRYARFLRMLDKAVLRGEERWRRRHRGRRWSVASQPRW